MFDLLSMTRKADYAIVALADLARRGPARASAREISEGTRVPLPVLTNILHQLLHSGLVTSAMGAKGGYCLARPAAEISLAAMIDAIEGTFKLTICCEDDGACDGDVCDLQDGCRIKEPVQRVHMRLRQFFDQVSLAQLAFNGVPIPVGVPGGALVGNETKAEALG